MPRRAKIDPTAVRRELERLLGAEHHLPLKGLGKRVGAADKDAKAAAHALVRSGAAVLVKDGRAEHLVQKDGSTLADSEIAAMGETSKLLKAALKKLDALLKTARSSRARPGYAIRRQEADARVDDLRGAVAAATPPAPAPPSRSRVLAAARGLELDGLGLVYVPDLVRALGPAVAPAVVHAALQEAASAGELELRPESGLDRLSQEERDACLVGPSGRLISYVRVVSAR